MWSCIEPFFKIIKGISWNIHFVGGFRKVFLCLLTSFIIFFMLYGAAFITKLPIVIIFTTEQTKSLERKVSIKKQNSYYKFRIFVNFRIYHMKNFTFTQHKWLVVFMAELILLDGCHYGYNFHFQMKNNGKKSLNDKLSFYKKAKTSRSKKV